MNEQDKFTLFNTSNRNGRLMEIPKDRLTVPIESYQREGSKGRIKRIADNFDPALLGVISARDLHNGYYEVIDGGHRVKAAQMLNGKIATLPCIVYDLSKKQAATSFLGLNSLTRRVGAHDKHRAGLVAGDPIAIETEQIVTDAGLSTSGSNHSKHVFEGIATLRFLVGDDADIARGAFNLCVEVADFSGDFPAFVLKAVYDTEKAIQKHYGPLSNQYTLLSDANIAKLKRARISGIENSIIDAMAQLREKSKTKTVRIAGVLDIINKNKQKQNRISLYDLKRK